MVFSAMLEIAFHDGTDSMTIRYRTDGKLFNLRRLQARTKVKEERVRDFLFADECAAVNASSEDDMQRNMDTFLSTGDAFGFTISTKKMSCFSQHPTQTTQIQPSLSRVRSCKL